MNRKAFPLLLVLLAALPFSVVLAQQKRTITLQEAVDLSLRNSNQLKNSNARTAEATAILKEAKDRRLPDATLSGSYLRLNNPNVDMKTKTSSTPSGGGGTEASPKPSQAAYALGNVSLPLYAGSRIRYGIESAKFLEQASKLDAEHDREAVILNTVQAYNNLYKARATVDLVQEHLRASRQRVTELSNLEKNGLLPRNDLLKAQLQSSNTELALMEAENDWKLAAINMDLMLGLSDSTELLPDSVSLQPEPSVKAMGDYVQMALQQRKDLSALEARKQSAAFGVKTAEGEKYPSIALTGGYVALNVPNVLTVTNAVNLGIGLQYNIASLWKSKSKIQQAQAREQQVVANEAILTDAIRLQVSQAYQQYMLNIKKMDVYARAVEQANENFRIVQNKYNNSLATTTELLDADAAQLQAKLNYSFSKSDAAVAYDQLLHAAGMLTPSAIK